MSCTKTKLSSTAPANALVWPSLITAGVLALSAIILFCFDPSYHGFYPRCMFYRSTGLLCPGCGSLRALHQLLHGHLAAAVRCNAMLITALPFLGWFAGRRFLLKPKQPPVIRELRPAWLWGGLGVLVVFSIARNLPWAGLAWLRP